MARNTHDMAQFREEPKPEPPPIDWDAKSPPVDPDLQWLREQLGVFRTPVNDNTIRGLRQAFRGFADRIVARVVALENENNRRNK